MRFSDGSERDDLLDIRPDELELPVYWLLRCGGYAPPCRFAKLGDADRLA